MKMTPNELEYAISQYIDGILPPLERNALEERLATDASARAMLEEYRSLDASLKGLPVPQIAWDQFSSQLNKALENEETPIRHYSMMSMGWTGRMAIAALVLLAISMAVYFVPRTSQTVEPTGIVVVSGPAIEESAGPVVAEISIGHSPSVAQDWRAAEEVISRPGVVLIDSARSSQDNDSPLY